MTDDEMRIAIATTMGISRLYSYALPTRCVGADVPRYMDDLDAALTLVDFLAAQGWRCNLANGLDKTWECEFMRPPTAATPKDRIGIHCGETLEIHYAPADTLARAICEAFLAVTRG